MPIRFFCDHCRQMLKIGTSKMGSVVDCPRCHKPVVVPPQSVPQAEQLYQMLKQRHAATAAPPSVKNIIPEPTLPESAWDELGGNVSDTELNQWIDELCTTNPAHPPGFLSGLSSISPSLSLPNPLPSDEIALLTLQKRHKLTITLLYVSSAVAFVVGLLFGVVFYALFVSSSRSHQHLAGHDTGINEITGTIFYRDANGHRLPDVEAVIICLPMDRLVAQQFSPQGLRPGGEVNKDTVQLIHEMGGMYARGDAMGSFTMHYQEGTRYFVTVISASQKRSGEIKSSTRSELSRFFRNPESFGDHCLMIDEYEWPGGKYFFRHTFETEE